jgi:hypothetical protein
LHLSALTCTGFVHLGKTTITANVHIISIVFACIFSPGTCSFPGRHNVCIYADDTSSLDSPRTTMQDIEAFLILGTLDNGRLSFIAIF